jgi:hypothetical protein
MTLLILIALLVHAAGEIGDIVPPYLPIPTGP